MEKTSLLLRLPKPLKDELMRIAAEKGVTTTGLILLILNNYCETRR